MILSFLPWVLKVRTRSLKKANDLIKRFEKPIVVVSQCLEFAHCRYDGEMVPDRFVRRLKAHVQFLPVCPEVEIGLGIPRDTIKVVSKKNTKLLWQEASGKDLASPMNQFAVKYLMSLKEVDGFLLKSRSPSCGLKDVKYYSKPEKSAPIGRGPGFFGEKVMESYPNLAIEDEARLNHLKIREHFYTKLFLFSSFRKVRESYSMKRLVEFQTCNKFLLMAYHPSSLKKLGQIVANNGKKRLADVLAAYEKILGDAFRLPAKPSNLINTLQHIFGFFSGDLSKKERDHFLKLLDKYKNEKVSLSSLIHILSSWVLRFDKSYLVSQTFFQPYPEELIEDVEEK